MSARPIPALNLARRRQSPRRHGSAIFGTFGGVFVWYGPRNPRGPKRVLMDGHEALADLKQISVQIEAAVIADHGGAVLACSPDDAADRRAAVPPRARDLGGRRRLAPRPRPRRAHAGRALDRAGQRLRRARRAPRAARDDGARSHGRARVLRPQVGAARARRPARAGRADRRLAGRRRRERRGARRWRGVGAGPRRDDARGRLGGGLRADLQAQARAQREPRRPLLRGRLDALASQGAPEADRLLPLAAEALAATGR